MVDLDTALKAAVLRYGIDGAKTQLEWVRQTRRAVAADAAGTRSKAAETAGATGEETR